MKTIKVTITINVEEIEEPAPKIKPSNYQGVRIGGGNAELNFGEQPSSYNTDFS